MPTTSRTLIVKAVGYQALRNTPEGWAPPRIEDEIRKIMNQGSTVGKRHYPWPEKKIGDGTHCLFINSCSDQGEGKPVLFTVCSYTKGHVPESIQPDMDSAEAAIQAVELKADDGKPSELVLTYRCLAFGQVVIVESVAGGGGLGGLGKLLRALVKRYSAKGHGLLELSDIGSSDLRALIKSRGGVVKMQASLVHEVGGEPSKFAQMLGNMRQSVRGTNRCVVQWHANEGGALSEDEAIALVEEADSDYLDTVSLSFKKGGGVSDLERYRERKPVRIQLTPEGRPAVTEIETELKKYLTELRNPNNGSPIKTDGTLRAVKKLET